MWYWTIPSLALTGVCLALPSYINAAGNWAETGHVIKNQKKFYIFLRMIKY